MSTPLSFHTSRITRTFLLLLLIIVTGGCNLDNGNPIHWFVSTSGNDNNDCKSTGTACRTIMAAVTKAADGDSIFIAIGTYQEKVSISKSISITGTSYQPADVIIDGNHQYQVLAVGCMACSKSIQVSNLVIQNGKAPTIGGFTGAGGVTATGTSLSMSNVTIQNNEAGQSGYGIAGGVYIASNAKLKISDSTISGNTNSNNATEGQMYAGNGAGIYNAGSLTITGNVTISNNFAQGSGGGIYNAKGAHADLTGATIQNNQSQSGANLSGGGGIYSDGELLVNGGVLQNNQAVNKSGGGLYSSGTTTLTGVTIDGNSAHWGGGIGQEYSQLSTRLTATNVTITNNKATFGGAVYNAFTGDAGVVASLGYLQIIQSTIAYNQATSGGGVFNDARASMFLINDTISNNNASAGGGIASGQGDASGLLLNVTVAYNTAGHGGGIATGGGNLQLQNVLLAQNTGQNCSTEYGGIISSYAGNLSDDPSCNLHAPLDQDNVDAKIGQLTYNGGPTQTISLNTGSPAIDAALEWLAPQVDQRSFQRGVDGNGDGNTGFDIGALELTSVVMSNEISPIQVVTATPSPYIFTVMQVSDCRSGPGPDYPEMTSLPVGAAPGAFSRSEDSAWFQLYQPGEYLCWALASNGTLSGDPAGLPARRLNPTLIPTITPTPVITLTPSLTPTPVPLTFTPNINANCRFGPDRSFPSVETAMTGQPYLMDGRNLDSTWYRIMISENLGCWVLADSGAPSSDPSRLRVLAEVPTFTPTFTLTFTPILVPSDTPTPVIICSSYTSADTCTVQPVCQWIPAMTHPGDCVNK